MFKIRYLSLLCLVFLGGCKLAILDPKGIIAASEKHLLVDATLLMLIVVIPVIIINLVFAWKYRASNNNAKYTPNWGHSNIIEVICWTIPCIIIGILAVMTWTSTHKLDPYRPLDMKAKVLTIEAIALDWKWLFIYPKQRIATVNYVQIPVDVPIRFLVTSDAPMNSLEIPQLAGQIYAMTGMRTKLNLVANHPGSYVGLSTNFSGDGFSSMRFIVKATSKEKFDQWVAFAQHSPNKLTQFTYHHLELPSENNRIEYFSKTVPHLFNKVIMKYMDPSIKLHDNKGNNHA